MQWLTDRLTDVSCFLGGNKLNIQASHWSDDDSGDDDSDQDEIKKCEQQAITSRQCHLYQIFHLEVSVWFFIHAVISAWWWIQKRIEIWVGFSLRSTMRRKAPYRWKLISRYVEKHQKTVWCEDSGTGFKSEISWGIFQNLFSQFTRNVSWSGSIDLNFGSKPEIGFYSNLTIFTNR